MLRRSGYKAVLMWGRVSAAQSYGSGKGGSKGKGPGSDK